MKKFFYLIMATIMLLSCSKSSDDSPSQNIKISPPTWIMGTWVLEGSDASVSSSFKFTADDFCFGFSNAYSCNKETLIMSSKAGVQTNVKESSSGTEYSIEMTMHNSVVIYQFQKISATKIKWTNNPYGSAIDAVFIKK